jgi:hypothetical protein
VWTDGKNMLAAALTASALLLGLAASQQEPKDLRHAHEGPRRVAVDATHRAQPAHFDSSSVRIEWHCSACVIDSRTVSPTLPAASALHLSPPLPHGLSDLAMSPIRPQDRRELSRAPPASL